jgi:hypothetical protein
MLKQIKLNLEKRANVIKDVLWSTAVQHGAVGAAKLVKVALEGKDITTMADSELIEAIYKYNSAFYPTLS